LLEAGSSSVGADSAAPLSDVFGQKVHVDVARVRDLVETSTIQDHSVVQSSDGATAGGGKERRDQRVEKTRQGAAEHRGTETCGVLGMLEITFAD
jgi:hypothetical protein